MSFTQKRGKFIRLRAITEVNGNPWTSMAELTALGNLSSGNVPPNGTIDSPSNDITINVGDTVTFAGTGSDPDNNLPLSYRWSFGAGSGIADSTLEDPGAKQFNVAGTYTVTFTVTDSLGASDPTPATRVITVLNTSGGVIPKTTDSQETVLWNGAAVNGFDNNSATIWHTKWNDSLPHEIQIDMGGFYDVNGFKYLPRQDGYSYGRIGQYEFYVSMDGVSWGAAVAAGTFVNSTAEKEVNFTQKTGKFIRLRAITEVNGNPWASMAELTALGNLSSGNLLPNSTIDSPSKDITIKAGDSINFRGTGADPDNNLPLTYRWSFGAGSGIADSTLEDPWPVQFNIPGSYTVTFTVTDSFGVSDPIPATRTITVLDSSFELIPHWAGVSVEPFNLQPAPYIANPVLTASSVTDVSARFVAGPFLFNENNQWYMFFGVLNNNTGEGDIGVATSADGYHWQYKQIVLNESFHLSYPLVFKYNGQYFMIPETNAANSIRLYEATNFPYNWQYKTTLVSGRPFVDTSIFWFNNTWWMFATDSANTNLYLYYSDNLLSGWVEHPKSPVVTGDSSKARPGGRPIVFDTDRIIRFAQKDNVIYGEQVRAFEVDVLTKTDYAEHEVPGSPILKGDGSGWNANGMHNADCWWTANKWICATDGWNISYNYDWSLGIYTSEPYLGVALGDSLTTPNPSYCTQFTDESDRGLCIPKGVGGQETYQVLARFDSDASIYSPSFVVFEAGINNINKSYPNDPQNGMKSDVQSFVAKCFSINAIPVLTTLPPIKNYELWNTTKQAWIDSYNSWIRSYASSNSYPILDLQQILADPNDYRALRLEYEIGDGIHPNIAGQIKIGDELINLLKPDLVGGTP
ncbi:MAG: discoidin domain-containing protein [Nitrospirae bacterium]|nr:discoidin domain-containing protein [Nitrospirota bacterium]